MDDALLVGDIDLVLGVLKGEIAGLSDDRIEPRLILSLSRLHLTIGEESRSLALFQRAASFTAQNRGYYTDLGHCAFQLCRQATSPDFAQAIVQAVDGLLDRCPFPQEMLRALGRPLP